MDFDFERQASTRIDPQVAAAIIAAISIISVKLIDVGIYIEDRQLRTSEATFIQQSVKPVPPIPRP
jgi:hypothetical protein